MRLIRINIQYFALGVLLIIEACSHASTSCQNSFTVKANLTTINNNLLLKVKGKSDTVRGSQKVSLLSAYNISCKLNFDLKSIIKDISFVSTLYADSNEITTRVIGLELCSFVNEEEAAKVYKVIDDKAIELRNTPRNKYGQFCVEPYALQIYYVFKNKCYLLMMNKQGDYSKEETEKIIKVLKTEVEKL